LSATATSEGACPQLDEGSSGQACPQMPYGTQQHTINAPSPPSECCLLASSAQSAWNRSLVPRLSPALFPLPTPCFISTTVRPAGSLLRFLWAATPLPCFCCPSTRDLSCSACTLGLHANNKLELEGWFETGKRHTVIGNGRHRRRWWQLISL
jgi:hypothetical protein